MSVKDLERSTLFHIVLRLALSGCGIIGGVASCVCRSITGTITSVNVDTKGAKNVVEIKSSSTVSLLKETNVC